MISCWFRLMCIVLVRCVSFFFFFKQKTAYEMRISDWSSDVCSSDLSVFTRLQGPFAAAAYAPQQRPDLGSLARDHFGSLTPITRFESEMGVLRAVSSGKCNIGVLPLPEADHGTPWWPRLARSGKATPKVIARLPFAADRKSTRPNSSHYCASRMP